MSVIELRDIEKSFVDNRVLRGVSLSAQEGEVISLIGSSGSGKSTLLRCANLLEVPNAGLVYVEGEEIKLSAPGPKRYPTDIRQLSRMRAKLGMVFQQFNLWSHRTILENVMEAPLVVQKRNLAEVREQARDLLELVGIGDKHAAYPAELSGGQQQRAAIARALCINPKVMLFDEPTSALDPELEVEVLRVITKLAEEGRTMLLVTHDMGFAAEVSQRTLFLNQGIIEEQGPSKELFKNPQSMRLRQFLRAACL